MSELELIRPDWPAPERIGAAITTRLGGESLGPYAEFNLSPGVGDEPARVEANRQSLVRELGLPVLPQWLTQVHGQSVVEAATDGRTRTADACFTDRPGLACAVMTADCLPVLLCNRAGTRVAAAHAGWRGLAGGVLAATVEQFRDPTGELVAYLGPALCQRHFEVGVEVLEAFFEAARDEEQAEAVARAFRPAERPLHFCADLYALAQAELRALGLAAVYGGEGCTFGEPERFYSYRRDGRASGRMASLIWIKP